MIKFMIFLVLGLLLARSRWLNVYFVSKLWFPWFLIVGKKIRPNMVEIVWNGNTCDLRSHHNCGAMRCRSGGYHITNIAATIADANRSLKPLLSLLIFIKITFFLCTLAAFAGFCFSALSENLISGYHCKPIWRNLWLPKSATIYMTILRLPFCQNSLSNRWEDLNAYVNHGLFYLTILISWPCIAKISYLNVPLMTTRHLSSYISMVASGCILFLARGLRIWSG